MRGEKLRSFGGVCFSPLTFAQQCMAFCGRLETYGRKASSAVLPVVQGERCCDRRESGVATVSEQCAAFT